MRFTITIEVEAPEGSTVRVGSPAPQSIHVDTSAQGFGEPTYIPPFEDELIPLPPDVVALPSDVNVQPGFAEGARIAQPTPFRASATGVVPPDYCPVHKVPWKVVPAGVSKKTGKPYQAFRACSERGCTQRPAA